MAKALVELSQDVFPPNAGEYTTALLIVDSHQSFSEDCTEKMKTRMITRMERPRFILGKTLEY